MAVDERARHELHGRLDDVLGRDEPVASGRLRRDRHHTDLDNIGKELRGETGQLRGRVPATWVSPLGR